MSSADITPTAAAGAAAPPERMLAAVAAMLAYTVVIGFTDNQVRRVAGEIGLWQFHATRSAIALLLLLVAARVAGIPLRPRNWRAVAGRSALHGTAMLCYFGSLAFLPVAIAAAGLFTAPIFVLLITRFAFGARIGPARVLAVAAGFAGTVLVLGPSGGNALSPAALAPAAGAVFYALGNIATRRGCAGETTATLTAGFFAGLLVYGLAGMAVLAAFGGTAPAGTAGFVLRPPVLPSPETMGWLCIQAAGAVFAMYMATRSYQLADASRASVLEYLFLPCAAIWGWLLQGDVLEPRALAGILLIVAAGTVIALRGARDGGGG
ncbi:DMT family transporter [Frigidibacter oleivorans]|uniref:DMT family transporter n=1 Tax=Frigidibacter oleivorans TaxID=2487129 RepID=UPI001F3FB48F|nr:DMT family transporter [Frigidibacter oleivorans]